MGKTDLELATDVAIALIKAKAEIISQIDNNQSKRDAIDTFLAEEDIAASIKTFFKAINTAHK